jgi:hypothetical protein
LHPALEELGWTGVVDEFNDAARLKDQAVPEPILITTNGTILAGFGRWRLAVFERRHEIHCIEYPLGEDESLQFILTYHQSRRGWNDFVRICLALKLEPSVQQKALDHMRGGGKYKGSARLPDLERIDVRREVASIAGVGERNVSNVKNILQSAHPRLVAALHEGALTIHAAMKYCSLPRPDQLERFSADCEYRAVSRVIRQCVPETTSEKVLPAAATILSVLLQQEAQQPGSVVIRAGRTERTVIVVGRDLLAGSLLQGELTLI